MVNRTAATWPAAMTPLTVLRSVGVTHLSHVVVISSIDATGKVTDVKLLGGSGYPQFDEAALAVAREEEFEPALRNGTPIPYTLKYTYRFRINDQ